MTNEEIEARRACAEIAEQVAEWAAAEARWQRIEAHAARFVAAAIFRGELYLSVPANTVAIGQAIALAETFVDAIDRRREELT